MNFVRNAELTAAALIEGREVPPVTVRAMEARAAIPVSPGLGSPAGNLAHPILGPPPAPGLGSLAPVMGPATGPRKNAARSGTASLEFAAAAQAVEKTAKKRGRDPEYNAGRWTALEDAALRKAVNEIGAKNWKKVANNYLRGNRTDVQCLHRWQKVLRPGLVKGPWKKEEDDIIRRCVEAGMGKWSEIAKQVEGRIGKQCRERWFNHLDPSIKRTEWTAEEDDMLVKGQRALGNKWSLIAKQYLPGRPENAVKNRWNAAARRKKTAELKKREVKPPQKKRQLKKKNAKRQVKWDFKEENKAYRGASPTGMGRAASTKRRKSLKSAAKEKDPTKFKTRMTKRQQSLLAAGGAQRITRNPGAVDATLESLGDSAPLEDRNMAASEMLALQAMIAVSSPMNVVCSHSPSSSLDILSQVSNQIRKEPGETPLRSSGPQAGSSQKSFEQVAKTKPPPSVAVMQPWDSLVSHHLAMKAKQSQAQPEVPQASFVTPVNVTLNAKPAAIPTVSPVNQTNVC